MTAAPGGGRLPESLFSMCSDLVLSLHIFLFFNFLYTCLQQHVNLARAKPKEGRINSEKKLSHSTSFLLMGMKPPGHSVLPWGLESPYLGKGYVLSASAVPGLGGSRGTEADTEAGSLSFQAPCVL